MELNREKIVKALACCSVYETCDGCPHFNGVPEDDCHYKAMANALALIRELTEEIERLRNRVTFQVVLDDEKVEEITNKCLERVELDIKEIQADTVRKMQELVEERLDISVCGYSTEEVKSSVLDTIDQVAKEILEEQE